ncbi:MAG: 4-hydroxythreonine-4-phosphate dehydrogenase PdxA [Pseudomonadota bacterium]
MKKPRIAITPGEPSGIGPEIAVKLAAQYQGQSELVFCADIALMQNAAQAQNLLIEFKHFHPDTEASLEKNQQWVWHTPLSAEPTPGVLNTQNASYVLSTLNAALNGIQQGSINALVTGPVHKGVINDAGIAFSGHTEYCQEFSHSPHVVMMLATHGLRVALATTHLPLRAVADAITPTKLQACIQIILDDLTHKFGINQPRLAVCGLNPHAGEMGHLGREEIEIISPAIQTFDPQQVFGPFPADTLLTPRHIEQYDCILAMYHDQGLPVLKYKGFESAVNITLGLPFVRTSVDHGTGLDIAGKNIASPSSLLLAVESAESMIASH